ncbi:TPA: hypothetical protein ACHI9W_000336 [Klebsiella pneumoniae]|uniref:hypothetical protein n=1 Tax=Klebsiella pneumoniae TaxID=573 RepID=UPI0015D73B1F|nr:hypothetical protein [Klebsiella pneumoniae]MCS5980658.1 hypothetical protein [Klebsiella pneumoniae subsp. pneumoniae]MBG9420548.1 hypothetical protein [Klebsiella pneumoniae]MCP6665449.1 hypothetical protein [Klebsiella pneumoniae]MEA4360771.1 hypothetical protein [Klebsiella pneumoniae]HBX4612867.1 hypothetical protein [Klebsiella pneumoniae]
MTYEEAMNLVARGGVVTRGSAVIYMSVNFDSGMAGKTVRSEGFGAEALYEFSEEDADAVNWVGTYVKYD